MAQHSQGFLIMEILRSQTHQTRQGLFGRVISPTQIPLPDNTQQLQETGIHGPARFEPAIPVCERPQTHALDRAATGISMYDF